MSVFLSGNGQALGLMEVAIKNLDGTWLTTSSGSGWPTADVGAAAAELVQSNTWPTDPTADFNSVSLINRAGNLTWPITSSPFMFVRVDTTPRGASGPLLLAFINYMLGTGQSALPSLGFGALPSVLLSLVLSKSVPLISVDNRYPAWFNEVSSGNAWLAAGDNVLAAAKDTYTRSSVSQLVASAAAAQLAAAKAAQLGTSGGSSSSGNVNISGINLNSLAGVSQLQSTQDNQSNQIKLLQNVAIAALAFALASLGLAIFAVVRLFVVSTIGYGHAGSLSGVMPGSMNAGSVKGTGSFRDGNDSGMH